MPENADMRQVWAIYEDSAPSASSHRQAPSESDFKTYYGCWCFFYRDDNNNDSHKDSHNDNNSKSTTTKTTTNIFICLFQRAKCCSIDVSQCE